MYICLYTYIHHGGVPDLVDVIPWSDPIGMAFGNALCPYILLREITAYRNGFWSYSIGIIMLAQLYTPQAQEPYIYMSIPIVVVFTRG